MLSRTTRRIALGAATAALAAACGGTTTEQLIGPTGSRCQIGVAAPPAVPASGSTLSLSVSAARDCTWTATSEAPWVTLEPTSGQGDGTVDVAVAANARPTSRSAAVAVNDNRVTISQEAAPCRFELASQGTHVDEHGGRQEVGVSTLDGCAWRVADAPDWVRVLTGSGDRSGTAELDVGRNEGPERSATLSIAGLPFVVSQDAARRGGPPDPPPPAACVFAIDPDRTTIPASGGQRSVQVATSDGCPWTASTTTSWISLQQSSGNGAGTMTYEASPNASTTSERSAVLLVAGRRHRVTQPACELEIEGGVPGFLAGGGDASFAVTTGAGCAWEAAATVDWITVTRSSGSGSGAVTYRVSPNPVERDRSGTIVVSGRAKTIVQQALGQGG